MHTVRARGILSAQNGMNLYRGCTHGCIYCDSRSRCYNMNHAFEDIEVKENALELLDDALRRKRRRAMISTGSMTDPYIPLEAKLRQTRGALTIIARHGFGATLITKSDLVLRDIDVLQAIHRKARCVVQMTLTTADEALCRKLEPGVCTTRARYEALLRLRDAGIPTLVWLCPILPFINDTRENIEGVLSLCADAGVTGIVHFGMGMTLREGSREYYYAQLDRLFPGLKAEYVRRYGNAYILPSPNAEPLTALFHETCERRHILHDNDAIFAWLHEMDAKPEGEQMTFL